MEIARPALRRSIAARLEARSLADLRVLDAVLVELEQRDPDEPLSSLCEKVVLANAGRRLDDVRHRIAKIEADG